jgi:hypothetical protein
MSKVIRHFFQQKAARKDSGLKRLEPISEQDAIEQQVAALTSVWDKSSLGARRAFLTRIDQRILTAHLAKNVPRQSD